jgi:effector-binding domain-containing protein
MKKMLFLILAPIVLSVLISAQEIQIREITPFSYAYLECSGSYRQIPAKIGTFMQEFFKQKLWPAGTFFGLYLNSPQMVKEEELQWQVGFPVTKDAEVAAPLKKGDFTHTQVAACLYVGPYENVGSAYNRIFEFIGKNGYEAAGPIMEKYLDLNPQSVKPADLRTEINIPVEKK